MKKLVALWLCVCMMTAMLAGCGSGKESGSAQTDEPAKEEETGAGAGEETQEGDTGEQVTLDMIWYTDGNETVSMQELIEEYESLHPNIKIEMQEIAFNDLIQKLQMAIAGGEAPALTRCTEGAISQLNDAMVDFSDYVDGEELKSQFLDSVNYLYLSGDKICAVPINVTANGMIYNKTAFDQAGVTVPSGPDDIWTWDEFKEDLRKVVDNSDVQYGLVIDNSSHRWLTMLYEFGGSLVAEKDGKLRGNLSSEESLNAIRFTKELFDEGLAVSSVWLSGEDPNNIFCSGQVAAQLAGTWVLPVYEEDIKDFEWDATYMPVGTTRSSVPGGNAIAVFDNTGVEKEAVDFAVWVSDQEQNEKYCKDSMYVSPRVDNANIEYDIRSDAYALFADELANTVPAAGIDFGIPGYAAQAMIEMMDLWPEVLTGAITPEEMAAGVDEVTNNYLDENGY